MRYLGGKSRLVKWIADEADKIAQGVPVWDAFCGGLSVSVEFARRGRVGLASDKHPALIALYQAVQQGWDPPTRVSEEEYHAAKLLPDSDPRKAFVGFGCAFGGKWFGGYARDRKGGCVRSYANGTRNALLRDVGILTRAGWSFACIDFLEVIPESRRQLIYCDPPYANTTGYTGVLPIDHAVFWTRCEQWQKFGTPVLVSEYSGPGRIVAQRAHKRAVGTPGKETIERLFMMEAA